jgi:tRNA dimethylallyltransferase
MHPSDHPPFFVIAGPTASGKSEIAVRVAERCGGEIVGADAFQVYEGLDILTAKPSEELRARIPHHAIGVVPLTRRFDVAQFTALAHQRIAEIHARGRLPIVCGGTGLYVRALIRGLADLPGADAQLRATLEAQPLEELQRRLAEFDPEAISQIDLNNPRRLIRALEVCLLTGRPFTSFRTEWERHDPRIRGIVLQRERTDLQQRIGRRTAEMFSAGVEEEVRALADIGPTANQAIGLREIRELLAGKRKREDCIRAIEEGTRQYAKRQMTWFRRETGLELMDVLPTSDADSIVAELTSRAAVLRQKAGGVD